MTDIADNEVPLPPSLTKTISELPFRIGLASQDLLSGNRFAYNENEVFPQASAIKIPILWQLESQVARGKLSLDEQLAIDPTNGAGGCGILQHFRSGDSQLCLADLAMLMIVQSDNVATNLLIDRVTIAAINEQLNQLGLKETRLRRNMMDHAARDAGQDNTSTPAEALRLMIELDRLSKTSDSVAQNVLETLRRKKESPFGAALPTTATLANKPGMLNGLRTEWAIVWDTNDTNQPIQYAVTLMIECGSSQSDRQNNPKLKQAIYQLSSLIHQHWSTATSK